MTASPAAGSSALTALIVEDDPAMGRLLSHWLSEVGYEVTIVTNGWDADTQVLSGGWSLVVCDVNLPGLSGLDVALHAKTCHPDTVTLVLTSDLKADVVREARRAGVEAFVPKPVSKALLCALAAPGRFVAPTGPAAGADDFDEFSVEITSRAV